MSVRLCAIGVIYRRVDFTMKARSIYLGLIGCTLLAVSAMAQGIGTRTLPASVATMTDRQPLPKQLMPMRSGMIIVEVKTGDDDFRPGSSITQQLLIPGGRSEPMANLRHYEIHDTWNGFAAEYNTWGIGAGEMREYYFYLSRRMPLYEVQAYKLKLRFDGAPRRMTDTYDNWSIDRLRVYTSGICSGATGTTLAQVSASTSNPEVWERMSGQNQLVSVPVSVTGEARNEVITKLEAEFWTGSDDLRGGAVATATVRLADGTAYPPVSLNRGAGWGGGSRNRVDINLPSPTLVSSIQSVEIGFDGAGRSFGEGYDNWNIKRVTIMSLEACKSDILFVSGSFPWWRATAENNEILLTLRQN
jgi:hypothetical protein